MAPRPRRMVDPDYAGAIRNGIVANLNGTRTTSSDFSTPQYSTPRPMNRTSGVAGRKTNTAGKLLTGSEVSNALSKGAPLTGSASGVKSISLKQAGEVLTQGAFSTNKNGLTMDAANFAFTVVPFGKLGKIAKGLIPGGRRIASAAQRVADAGTSGNRARLAQSQQLRTAARETMDEATGLRRPTFVGSDLYESTYKKVDEISDTYETSRFRVGQNAGESAWQRAQDEAQRTGRAVTRKVADGLGGSGLTGETFSLRPTAAEIARSEVLDRGAGAVLRQADDLARRVSPYAGNPGLAARELKRRLNALRTVPVRKTPFREPRNPAL